MTLSQNNFIRLAFEKAKVNLGSTKKNPSVGCVVEKNGSIISSGSTSINGRPHAEFNALNKNIDFKNSNLYVTLEPCSHYGKTPPCTNLIKIKKIKKIFFPTFDEDLRTKKKSLKLIQKKIKVKSNLEKTYALDFYKSYFLQYKSDSLPLIDGKIALSKDYFTIDKKKKWITSLASRKRVHLLRSMYDCILSTSKSINSDNSMLDCRLDGLEDKSPDLVILDRSLKLKKKLKLISTAKKRKIIIVTSSRNKKKMSFFKKKGIFFLNFRSLNSYSDFVSLFQKLKKNYSRIFVESGLTLMNFLVTKKFLSSMYVFKTNKPLKKNGVNFSSNTKLKKLKLKSKLKIHLSGDELFKVKFKNV